MKKRLNELLPPGYGLKNDLLAYIWAWIMMAVGSLSFFAGFFDRYRSLYIYRAGVKKLAEDAAMPPLEFFLQNAFAGLWVVMAVGLVMMLSHLWSYSRESKSIYLMRRLPVRLLVKQIITLPLLAMAAAVLLALLLLGIYAAIYYGLTPREALPFDNSLCLWRLI